MDYVLVVIAAVALLILTVGGVMTLDSSAFAHQCDSIGAFNAGGHTYECHRIEPKRERPL